MVLLAQQRRKLLAAGKRAAPVPTYDCGAIPGTVTATLGDDGTLTISGVGKMADYNYRGAPWYAYISSITKAVIEDGVTSIGNGAFYDCNRLKSVAIPDCVASIGGMAFYNCTGLMSVAIPDGVASIGEWAFCDCTGLRDVAIPGSVASIGSAAFRRCAGLTSLTIGDGVASIGSDAFSNCPGLVSVVIPGSVDSIEREAFAACTGLKVIEVAQGNANYSSENGVVLNKNKTTLVSYPGGKRGAYTIPNGVTSIENLAFALCTELTSVAIPDSVTSIGEGVFAGCTGLRSVVIPNSVTSIKESAFYECTGLFSVIIGKCVTSIGRGAFCKCDGLKSVTSLSVVPPAIDDFAFDGAVNASVRLCVPESSIEAYSEIHGLKDFSSINVAESVVSGNQAMPLTNYVNSAETELSTSVIPRGLSLGPNPVERSRATPIVFFHSGANIKSATLHVYDTLGHFVAKIDICDVATANIRPTRVVGKWDLCDSKGSKVPAGRYVIRGAITTRDGLSERMSVVVNVK